MNSSHHYSELAHKHFEQYGIKVAGVELDVGRMLKQKDDAVAGLTQGIEYLFKKNGVRYVKGKASFVSPSEVSVALMGGAGAEVIRAKNFVIATGSDVMDLPGVKRDEKHILSSTGALAIPAVPKSMLVIGGGVIGLELGSVWQRLGAQVTVVEYLEDIAAGADKEVAKNMQRILKKQGMRFEMQQKVLGAAVLPDGQGVEVSIQKREDGSTRVERFEKVLVSIGRRPYTDGLALERAGVQLDERGRVRISHGFRTSVPNIYAIGDVVVGPMLAHKAGEEAHILAEQLAGKGEGHLNYDAIPSVIYTHPEVAWVGATEEQLQAKGIKFKKGKFPFSANSRAKTVAETEGFVKILADAETDRILGAHIIQNNAGEMIAELGLAMEYEASSEDVARATHAHPTLMEAVKEAAMATYDKAIHI